VKYDYDRLLDQEITERFKSERYPDLTVDGDDPADDYEGDDPWDIDPWDDYEGED
jgi:hypothetical protein